MPKHYKKQKNTKTTGGDFLSSFARMLGLDDGMVGKTKRRKRKRKHRLNSAIKAAGG